MSLKNYGMLKCYPVNFDQYGDDNHVLIHAVADNKEYSLAVNVQSDREPVNMKYVIMEYNLNNNCTSNIQKQCFQNWITMNEGWYSKQQHHHIGIDYIRQHWVQKEHLQIASYTGNPDNELGEAIEYWTQECMKEPEACIFVFGQLWGPVDKSDRNFGFCPAMGIHDIHMNQYVNNATVEPTHQSSYQDGAIFYYLPKKKVIIGVYCLFMEQW